MPDGSVEIVVSSSLENEIKLLMAAGQPFGQIRQFAYAWVKQAGGSIVRTDRDGSIISVVYHGADGQLATIEVAETDEYRIWVPVSTW